MHDACRRTWKCQSRLTELPPPPRQVFIQTDSASSKFADGGKQLPVTERVRRLDEEIVDADAVVRALHATL